MFSSVDLPEPDGPTIASEVPCSSRRLTSRSATTGGSAPNVRPTPAQLDDRGGVRLPVGPADVERVHGGLHQPRLEPTIDQVPGSQRRAAGRADLHEALRRRGRGRP